MRMNVAFVEEMAPNAKSKWKPSAKPQKKLAIPSSWFCHLDPETSELPLILSSPMFHWAWKKSKRTWLCIKATTIMVKTDQVLSPKALSSPWATIICMPKALCSVLWLFWPFLTILEPHSVQMSPFRCQGSMIRCFLCKNMNGSLRDGRNAPKSAVGATRDWF